MQGETVSRTSTGTAGSSNSVPRVGSTTTDMTMAGRRDAAHQAMVLAHSKEVLLPGESVAFVSDDYDEVTSCSWQDRHGIVDPWVDNSMAGLAGLAGTDQHLFWVWLAPGVAHGLRHEFDIVTADDRLTCADYDDDEPPPMQPERDWCQTDCDN